MGEEKTMKKQLKRIIAIVSALAMIVTGMAFNPTNVKAVNWTSLTPGEKNNVGVWTVEPVKHYEGGQVTDWAKAEVDMDSVDDVEGFDFKQTGYSWNGTIINTSDLKSIYNLEQNKDYRMTLELDINVNDTKKLAIGAKTNGGNTNMAEDIQYANDGDHLTFSAIVNAKSRAFQLYIYYGACCIKGETQPNPYDPGALLGELYVDKLTFTDPSGETTTTADPTVWNHVTTTDDPETNPKNYVPEEGSPWTLNSNNDGVNTWGDQDCKIDPDASGVSRLHIRKNYGDGGNGGEDGRGNKNDWWWDSASLMGSGKAVTTETGTTSGYFNLTDGERYTGQIVVHSSAATATGLVDKEGETFDHTFRAIVFGNAINVPLNEGDTTINIPEFKFNSAENNDVRFVYVELPKDTEIYFKSITFTNTSDGWTKVTPSPDGEHPVKVEHEPWTFVALNNSEIEPDPAKKTWGDIRYKDDPSYEAGTVGATLIKPMATTFTSENPSHYYWNTARLVGYLADAGLVNGKPYSATITYNYTRPSGSTAQGSPELRYVFNGGDVVDVPVENIGENTIEIPEFDYTETESGDILFELDRLEAGSIFQVTDITFTPIESEWTRVTDSKEEGDNVPVAYDSSYMQTGVVIHNWNLFAGYWGGEGAALYYKGDKAPRDPLTVKIGKGGRWNPASAQVKLKNSDAYQELADYTNYYMTYSFTSTKKGTVHINQEGYEPEGLQRLDITDDMLGSDGLYHVTYNKIFTYLPESNKKEVDGKQVDANLSLFLSEYTYRYNEETHETETVLDGDHLPQDTILSDFKVEFSRQDSDYWTLVTDSREEHHQITDTIVKDADDNPLLQAYANSYNKGRLSYKAGYNTTGKNDTAKMGVRIDQTAYSQIPGYTFDESWGCKCLIPNNVFYNKKDTNGNDLVSGNKYMLRFYYRAELPNGTTVPNDKGLIVAQEGYRMNQWARYTGVKDADDGLNMLAGSITPKNGAREDAYIAYDGVKSGGIEFNYDPTHTTANESFVFDFSEFPEGTIISGIDWEFYAPGYDVYLDGSSTPDNADPVVQGKSYTFPTKNTPGYENAVRFVDANDPTKTYALGSTLDFTDFTADVYADAIREYDVTITHRDTGATLRTGKVETNEYYTLPTIAGIKDYTYNGQTYNAGDRLGPAEGAMNIIANPSDIPVVTHTVTIEHATTHETLIDPPDTVEEGGDYKLPAIDGIVRYEYNGQDYAPGDEIQNITTDITVIAYPEQYSIYIDDWDTPVAIVDEGGSYTLPSGPTAANIGYVLLDDNKLYSQGTKFDNIDEDMYFVSINEIKVSQKKGAAMQFVEDTDDNVNERRGIRFAVDFGLVTQQNKVLNRDTYKDIYAMDAFKVGTIITTYDHYLDYFDEELDLNTIAQAHSEGHDDYFYNILNDGTFGKGAKEGEYKDYARCFAAIIKLRDANITRDYIARGYAYVQYADDTTSDVVYGDITPSDQYKRSIKQIATIIKQPENEDEYNAYDEWKRDIIDYCAAFED